MGLGCVGGLNSALLDGSPVIGGATVESLAQQLVRFGKPAAANGGVDQQLVEQVSLGMARPDASDLVPNVVQMVDGVTVRPRSGARAPRAPAAAQLGHHLGLGSVPSRANRSHDAMNSRTARHRRRPRAP